MQLILLESVDNLGNAGDLVQVKPGYGRNFLIPQGKAIMATPRNLKQYAHQQRIAEAKRAKLLDDLRNVKAQLDGKTVSFKVKAGVTGKLFGSVTTRMIAEQIMETREIHVDRRKIVLTEPIKSAGDYHLEIHLDREVSATIHVEVIADIDEEEMAKVAQAKAAEDEQAADGIEGDTVQAEGDETTDEAQEQE